MCKCTVVNQGSRAKNVYKRIRTRVVSAMARYLTNFTFTMINLSSIGKASI